MDKTKLGNTGLELPPLRTLDDFLLESARFQIPNVKDLDKWANRVVNNLLYYQTNYFFMSVIIFLIVGWVDDLYNDCRFFFLIDVSVFRVIQDYFSCFSFPHHRESQRDCSVLSVLFVSLCSDVNFFLVRFLADGHIQNYLKHQKIRFRGMSGWMCVCVSLRISWMALLIRTTLCSNKHV